MQCNHRVVVIVIGREDDAVVVVIIVSFLLSLSLSLFVFSPCRVDRASSREEDLRATIGDFCCIQMRDNEEKEEEKEEKERCPVTILLDSHCDRLSEIIISFESSSTVLRLGSKKQQRSLRLLLPLRRR